jgi:prevent-host-death family protein
MEETVGIRELKNSLSRVIERVEKGESITVTRRGKPVVKIMSTTMPPKLAALIASGAVRPPRTGSRHTPKRIKLRGPGPTAAEYVSEGRR